MATQADVLFEKELKRLIISLKNVQFKKNPRKEQALQKKIIHFFLESHHRIHIHYFNAHHNFSFMEMICLALLATGKYAKTVAAVLDVTEHAIDFYERKIREELNAVNRVEALHKAFSREYLTYYYYAT